MECRSPLLLALFVAFIAGAAESHARAVRCEEGEPISMYSKERGRVHYFDIDKRQVVVIAGADARSFTSLWTSECSAGYARDKGAAYYEGRKIPGADPKSIEAVTRVYARDAAWWYGEGARIASRKKGDLRPLQALYAQHPEGHFYGALRVDATALEVLGDRGYARSPTHAFFQGKAIPGIDAASFVTIPNAPLLARDRQRVVVNGQVDERFHAASFEILAPNGVVARDRGQVYWDFKPLAGVDPLRFERLGQGYWRDTKAVFFDGKVVPGADAPAFRLIDRGNYGIDGRRVFKNGEPLDVDAATFQVIAFGYAKDRNGVYHYGRKLQGADPETFTASIDGKGWDKNHGYDYPKRVCAWAPAATERLPRCDPVRYGR